MISIIRKFTAILILLLACCLKSYATWSIIVVDPRTNEIGIAGASCTYSCYGIGRIIPGKGAVMVQAMSNKRARNKGLRMMKAGAAPKAIMAAMRRHRYDPERQQYAIVSVRHPEEPMTYTGKATNPHNGALTTNGVAVQGNTLASEGAMKAILDAALQAQKAGLGIEETLMLALEAGAAAGGDKRCGTQTATSAFLTVARPNDRRKKPYLNLVVSGQQKGGANAVHLLREKYDRWKAEHWPKLK